MINIRSFICPNCLTEFPVTTDLILALDEMELIRDKYRPTICPMCGASMLVDDKYNVLTISEPIAISAQTAAVLQAMRQYVQQMNLSRYKQPWNN